MATGCCWTLCINLKRLPNSLGGLISLVTKDFERIVFFDFFNHKLMLEVKGGASKMCDIVQCWDTSTWRPKMFIKRTWLVKMHARTCWTNPIFTSTTINVLKKEGNQWRLLYVISMMWTIVVTGFSYFKLTPVAKIIGLMKPHGWQYNFASKIVQWNVGFEVGEVKLRTLRIKGKERECVRYFTFHCHGIGMKMENWGMRT